MGLVDSEQKEFVFKLWVGYNQQARAVMSTTSKIHIDLLDQSNIPHAIDQLAKAHKKKREGNFFTMATLLPWLADTMIRKALRNNIIKFLI